VLTAFVYFSGGWGDGQSFISVWEGVASPLFISVGERIASPLFQWPEERDGQSVFISIGRGWSLVSQCVLIANVLCVYQWGRGWEGMASPVFISVGDRMASPVFISVGDRMASPVFISVGDGMATGQSACVDCVLYLFQWGEGIVTGQSAVC
jgi:hypothetical protein